MLRTDTGSHGVPAFAAMMVAVAVASGIASASGDLDGGVTAARKIVIRDDELISSSTLTMSQDDVLEFENDSGHFMRLVFVEPKDQTDKIRCYPIDLTIARPDQKPWRTATIPPGTFASACSLAPGQYAFVAARISPDRRGAEDSLGTKGTITVQ